MTSPIAFIARDRETTSAWCDALSSSMPGETIVPFADLTACEKAEVQIAIVANPDPAELAELHGLAWIQSLWAGVERLLTEMGPAAPPIVRLVDPELARTMAEAVLAWTYYLQREMPAYRQQQEQGVWKQRAYKHPRDITIGLLGLGTLGAAAAERLTGAGFCVKGWSRSPKTLQEPETYFGEAALDAVLSSSDIVVCLVPLTFETRGLINARRLAAMKRGANLINFSRGAVVVAEDLITALDSEHLSHAVLDVFDVEPLPGTSPLWSHPKVTVLPHISAPTDPDTAAAIVAANIRAYRRDGIVPATISATRGY
ncbi:2-hydroxyacid dehydrogenase [Rhizobium rhizophilum]|uniref:Glyoxylate/hydroxypyruvate reductase A n=1 Tax=Rhizobium rhizophilum TaxID=1850373 RepID=A0ABY2QR78_9HYPH|nr:glyoxylate/hydroxypyruvate reductase A [Rhizobium rhizophilum]THV12525.1 glyoxylate/hydroxypyruvate reductase A [Rhizobium rhizophilum]